MDDVGPCCWPRLKGLLKITALTLVDNKILSGNNADPLISSVEQEFGQTFEIPV